MLLVGEVKSGYDEGKEEEEEEPSASRDAAAEDCPMII